MGSEALLHHGEEHGRASCLLTGRKQSGGVSGIRYSSPWLPESGTACHSPISSPESVQSVSPSTDICVFSIKLMKALCTMTQVVGFFSFYAKFFVVRFPQNGLLTLGSPQQTLIWTGVRALHFGCFENIGKERGWGGHHLQWVSRAESCGRNSERQNPFKLSLPVGRSSLGCSRT